MFLSHFRMLIHELLKSYPDIVPDEAPLIIFDSKSAICMAKNSRGAKHPGHISRRLNFVTNGEKCKMQKIDWCEGGLKVEDIATKNFGDNYLNPNI